MEATVRRSSRPRKVLSYASLLNQKYDDHGNESLNETKSEDGDDSYLDHKTKSEEGDESYLDQTLVSSSEESYGKKRGNKRKNVLEMVNQPVNELSEYERNIMKKIEERNKFMAQMGFPEAIKDVKAALPVKVVQEKPKIKKPRISAPKEVLPKREPSRRLRNLAAANAKHIKSEIDEEIANQEKLVEVDDRLLDTLKMEEDLKVEINSDICYNPDLDLSSCDIAQYRDQLSSMKFLKMTKMNPGRIQSLHVHSTFPNPIIFSGDKYGNFGIWRTIFTDDEDVITYQPHRAGLNCISTSLDDKSVLYTTGYDGTIVQIDLSHNTLTNIFATDFDDRVSHITWHDEFENKKFFIAHGRGDVGILDSAAGKTVRQWIDCFPRSVKTVQHHPTQSHYFIASSGTGNVKIFDLRNPMECVTEEKHLKSVSSAFFSPDGNSVLTNSHDDHIRVFDSSVISSKLKNTRVMLMILKIWHYRWCLDLNLSGFFVPPFIIRVKTNDEYPLTGLNKETASYAHNNFTGRWLTPFKAVWVPQRSDVFHIGSMLNPRRMRFYKSNSDGVLMDVTDENVETICSTIAMHPLLPIVVGANSSGKVHLFGPPDLFEQK